jgi:hypothetical protein
MSLIGEKERIIHGCGVPFENSPLCISDLVDTILAIFAIVDNKGFQAALLLSEWRHDLVRQLAWIAARISFIHMLELRGQLLSSYPRILRDTISLRLNTLLRDIKEA